MQPDNNNPDNKTITEGRMAISRNGAKEELLKINSFALANLLVKLIHTGGTELAQVMMHHFGETAGKLMAKFVKENWQPKDENEWIMYYPQVHANFGQGDFTITKVYLDKADSNYQVHGTLTDSYLAGFYRDRFGVALEPVDWLERGYISGYTNEILGITMIFREVQCIAKDDPICEFIGKSKNNLTK